MTPLKLFLDIVVIGIGMAVDLVALLGVGVFAFALLAFMRERAGKKAMRP